MKRLSILRASWLNSLVVSGSKVADRHVGARGHGIDVFGSNTPVSLLHRPIAGRPLMLAQIQHLLELTKRPNVTRQMVPYQFGAYAAEGSFTMLRFAERQLPDVVFIEHLRGALYLDKRSEPSCTAGSSTG